MNSIHFLKLKLSKVLFLGLVVLQTSQVNAYPVSPSIRDVSYNFPIELQAKFTLLADSYDPYVVYYIAKNSSIDSLAQSKTQPDFVVTIGVSQIPFLPGESLQVAGTFNTTGSAKDFEYLKQQATDKGLVLQPAPIVDSKTRFLVTGFETNDQGKIEPICELKQVTFSTGQTVDVPVCQALDANNILRPLEFFYDLRTSAIYPFGKTNQNIKFDAMLFPIWRDDISTLLVSGQSWDPYIIGQMAWRINNGARIPVARVTVNWIELYLLAVDYIKKFENILTQSQALTFARELAIDPRIFKALQIQLEPGISFGPWWNPNLELIKVMANELSRIVNEKAFNTFLANKPGTEKDIQLFSISLDLARIESSPTETFTIYQNNSTPDLFVNTDLSIECIYGFIDQPILWSPFDPRCDDLKP